MGMTRWVGQCGRREAAFWAGRCCDLKTSEDGGCDNKAVLGWAVALWVTSRIPVVHSALN